jgi:hypothetical protein
LVVNSTSTRDIELIFCGDVVKYGQSMVKKLEGFGIFDQTHTKWKKLDAKYMILALESSEFVKPNAVDSRTKICKSPRNWPIVAYF